MNHEQSIDIGVDLGTTFSVIAVKGRVQFVDGYPEGLYLEECDVTIIPTPFGEHTVPSVFWQDPENTEHVLVGSEAKDKAKEGECPIMFSKRSIGTNEPLRVNNRTFTAREVATYILKYLKEIAEKALGRPVRRAVVTHPAYFDRNQVEETREASAKAGFDMGLSEQMMMEPAAAALAYIQGEKKDPLLVMTYDLGGGTFDVTVLERREGVITMKAFNGDHLLGGYNFDRELVEWIRKRLDAAGLKIPYDENSPGDRARRAQLLQLAEQAKIDLTALRTDKVPHTINDRKILVDADGKSVQIFERITRGEYSALIKDYIDKTITCCHSALAKADVKVEDLDYILLVGGSSRGQWVKDAVKKAFKTDPQLFDPDMCVAAGAAIKAAQLPFVASSAGIELVLDVPSTSPLPRINVTGQVRASGGADLEASTRAELKVLLTTPQVGTLGPQELTLEGRFLFSDLQLLEDEPSNFTLQVSDDKGHERVSKQFAVSYQVDAGDTTEIATSLPKPLYLKTVTGMKLIAEEGKPLPAPKCEVHLKRQHSDPKVDIEVYQEEERIGLITVENIPADAGEGCPVHVQVEITAKNEIKGSARVLNRAGAVVAERPVRITFPPIRLPDLPELRARFEELEDQRQQLIALTSDAEHRLLLGGQGAKLSKKLQKLFDELEPDKQEIYRALKELERLVEPPPEDMDPPRAQFRRLLDECRDMIAAKGADPQLDPIKTALSRIEADGNNAYTTKNHKQWATANENLAKLHDRLEKLTGADGGGSEPELPPTPVLKDHFKQEVDGLRAALNMKREELEPRPDYAGKLKSRCDNVETMLDKAEADIEKIDDKLEPKRAVAQLQIIVRSLNQPRPLKERIPKLDIDI